VTTGDSTLSCDQSFRSDAAPRSAFSVSEAPLFEILSRWQADAAGHDASSSSGPGCFSSLR